MAIRESGRKIVVAVARLGISVEVGDEPPNGPKVNLIGRSFRNISAMQCVPSTLC